MLEGKKAQRGQPEKQKQCLSLPRVAVGSGPGSWSRRSDREAGEERLRRGNISEVNVASSGEAMQKFESVPGLEGVWKPFSLEQRTLNWETCLGPFGGGCTLCGVSRRPPLSAGDRGITHLVRSKQRKMQGTYSFGQRVVLELVLS